MPQHAAGLQYPCGFINLCITIVQEFPNFYVDYLIILSTIYLLKFCCKQYQFNPKIIIFSFSLLIWNQFQVGTLTEILLELSVIYRFIKSLTWIWGISQVVGNNLDLQNRIWSAYCERLSFILYLHWLSFFWDNPL